MALRLKFAFLPMMSIIAIDGLKATMKLVEKFCQTRRLRISILAFRRDELMSFDVKAAGSELTEVELKVEESSESREVVQGLVPRPLYLILYRQKTDA